MIFGWGAQCAEKAAEKEQSEDAESENAQTRLVISAGKVAQAKVVDLRCAKCAIYAASCLILPRTMW